MRGDVPEEHGGGAPRQRLLIVITLAEVGGAQSYVRDLLPGLVDEFDVTVAAHGPGPLVAAAAEAGAAYVPLRHVRRPIAPLRDLLGLIELWRLCRSLRPAIVHANSSKAGVLGRLAAALARVPVRVFTAHGWAFKATSGAGAQLYLLADRGMRRLTTAIVCVSEEERRAGIAAGTCSEEATAVIHNGVDLAAPRAGGRERGPVRVVSVGRLAAPKDQATLLRAVARLGRTDVELELLGDGPDRGRLASEAARLGLDGRITFRGEVDDVPARLAGADVFCLASRSEGLPISVLEAMAAGLPVVASAIGGLHELVEEGKTGFLVAAGDEEQLAQRLGRLVDDASLRRHLGAAGRARAERDFSIATFRQRHLALYRSLLAAAGIG